MNSRRITSCDILNECHWRLQPIHLVSSSCDQQEQEQGISAYFCFQVKGENPPNWNCAQPATKLELCQLRWYLSLKTYRDTTLSYRHDPSQPTSNTENRKRKAETGHADPYDMFILISLLIQRDCLKVFQRQKIGVKLTVSCGLLVIWN